jgi:4-oxalmesaconate hydratase
MVGAVRGIDPITGFYFDDTNRYVDALDISETERHDKGAHRKATD